MRPGHIQVEQRKQEDDRTMSAKQLQLLSELRALRVQDMESVVMLYSLLSPVETLFSDQKTRGWCNFLSQMAKSLGDMPTISDESYSELSIGLAVT